MARSQSSGSGSRGWPHGFGGGTAPRAVVAIVSVVDPGGVTEVGVNVPVAAAGNPVIVNVTALENPPDAPRDIVKLADCPAVTVADVGAETVKSAWTTSCSKGWEVLL